MEVQHMGARNADSVLRWVQRKPLGQCLCDIASLCLTSMGFHLSSGQRLSVPNLERIHVTGESAGGWATFAWTSEAGRHPASETISAPLFVLL